jgi:serine/threonine protein kinase
MPPTDPDRTLPPEPTVDPGPTFSPADPDATRLPDADTTPAGPVEGLPADLAGHPRYRVDRLVGQGGMGAVYEAEHRLMGRTVALKVIHPRYTSSPAAVERFRREVRSAASLAHPNVVAAHDAEQAGRTFFLVMEFVRGESLAALVRRRGPLPVRDACEYARQACLGLQHAFEKGLIHRDVKPDNLMLADDGTVKVLDFGLARLHDTVDAVAEKGLGDGQLTAAGSVMGTPDYIAPEQAADAHSADIRADLYSLGCTLYQLLTGQVPFAGSTLAAKLRAHAERKPVPMVLLRQDVPAEVTTVVDRLMAKRPEDRYATPKDAADALAPFAAVPKKPTGFPVWPLVVAAGLALAAAAWWIIR